MVGVQVSIVLCATNAPRALNGTSALASEMLVAGLIGCADINRIMRGLFMALVSLLAIVCHPAVRASGGNIATYNLTVSNFWNQANHESWADPFDTIVGPHFSHLGGGTHSSSLSIWNNGELSSPGMIVMQETGWIDHPNAATVDLKSEFDTHIAGGSAYSFLNYPMFFLPIEPPVVVSLDVNSTHPLVTLVSMLGPSPDWFIGVSGLNMRAGGVWRDTITVDLFTFNGGTRSNDETFLCCENGPLESPQKAIALFTDSPDSGDPSRTALTSAQIGTFTFVLQNVQGQPGDYDGDDDVDGNDFLVLQRNPSVGSISEWEANFGSIATIATVTKVPEPASFCLALLGLGLLVLNRKE